MWTFASPVTCCSNLPLSPFQNVPSIIKHPLCFLGFRKTFLAPDFSPIPMSVFFLVTASTDPSCDPGFASLTVCGRFLRSPWNRDLYSKNPYRQKWIVPQQSTPSTASVSCRLFCVLIRFMVCLFLTAFFSESSFFRQFRAPPTSSFV